MKSLCPVFAFMYLIMGVLSYQKEAFWPMMILSTICFIGDAILRELEKKP